jgi:hypothetical protein
MERILTTTEKASPRIARLAAVPKGFSQALAVLTFLAVLTTTNPAAAEGVHRIKKPSNAPRLLLLVNSSSISDNSADYLGVSNYPENLEAHPSLRSTPDTKSLAPSSQPSLPSPLKGALNLNLEHAELAKRNDLESLAIKPWTPGRGSLGVKLEVTW